MNLEKYKGELSHDLKIFSNEVIEDIQQFGSLPRKTIKKMADASSAQEMDDILLSLARIRGFDYVYKLRDRVIQEEIVVTVQRNWKGIPITAALLISQSSIPTN